MRAVAVVYAGLLVVGSLGVIAMGVYVYGQTGLFIVTGAVLLMGAVVFFWALGRGGTHPGTRVLGHLASKPS